MKKQLKRLYHFIFHDDSLLSWIVNVIIAFLIVKFIIYPLIGLLLSTPYPLVAVVSGSMEHNSFTFDEYWDMYGNYYESKYQITKSKFKNFPYSNGFKRGDIMVLKGSKDIKVGDIIVYENSHYKYPIIHRVIKIYKKNSITYYKTKGDHNPKEDPVDTSQIIGKAVWKIPKLGYLKIIVTDYLNPFRR